jgi:hypothetical protein
MANSMIIRCSYCNRCLNETEYTILNRKVRTGTKRKLNSFHKYNAKDSDIKELQTMSGGEKHLWLRNHRDEILEYLEQNGDNETRRHYGIARLDILQYIEKWNIPYSKTITKNEILESTIRILESEIRDLKSKLPSAISKLSPEEQVKLLTFQLSDAVSRLQNTTHANKQLRIDQLYNIDNSGKSTPKL